MLIKILIFKKKKTKKTFFEERMQNIQKQDRKVEKIRKKKYMNASDKNGKKNMILLKICKAKWPR